GGVVDEARGDVVGEVHAVYGKVRRIHLDVAAESDRHLVHVEPGQVEQLRGAPADGKPILTGAEPLCGEVSHERRRPGGAAHVDLRHAGRRCGAAVGEVEPAEVVAAAERS